MKVSNAYVILSILGVQFLETSVNAYILLTANLDHLKAISNRLQKSPIFSRIQAALEQFTNRKLLARSERRKQDNLARYRSYNRRSYQNYMNDDEYQNPYQQPFYDDEVDYMPHRRAGQKLYRRKVITERAPEANLNIQTNKKKYSKINRNAPRFNTDKKSAMMSGQDLRSQESSEPKKGIKTMKNVLRQRPDDSSDYEDILKYVHIAEDHNDAVRKLRDASDRQFRY